ncbi:hypothetical protein JHK82_055266 [Glycine max]|uniref:Uncharacterized protein n=1 Tax=Glycine max TaxID=3847 RepID=A0A0R0EHV5_SOYBN|nr:hypothetical protein JHK86_055103 [Glycine max]KAG4917793.1 hypothetical protein JHK85_056074 [Glycine max]KAG5073894.1 hypothetical protein JHK84_055125 [Glycine max]KAG5076571.1 hypothetical protein JHK82_055266 [Glycine max]
MFLMVSGFINYSQQIVRAARYIGQGYTITLSHANRLPVTIQYPYEKIIALIEHTQENYSDPRNICEKKKEPNHNYKSENYDIHLIEAVPESSYEDFTPGS